MEAIAAPMALAALGAFAASNVKVRSGGVKGAPEGVRVVTDPSSTPHAQQFVMDRETPGLGETEPQKRFDPVRAHYEANAMPGRPDNITPLRTVFKDPKYALTPESGNEFAYDQQNRGSTHLENQWYYSNLTKDSETPLSMGYLPQFQRSTGITLRDPSTPDMLKPQKRELLEDEVWVAQPEQDRKFVDPITQQQARRARNTARMAEGVGALDGFYMNDKPGTLGGPSKGWSTGLEPTRTGRVFGGVGSHHTGIERRFRKHDNLRQRNPHGLRAGLKSDSSYEMRADLEGQYSNEKKQQISDYHAVAVSDGGRKEAHLPHDLRKVELLHTSRDSAPATDTYRRNHTYSSE